MTEIKAQSRLVRTQLTNTEYEIDYGQREYKSPTKQILEFTNDNFDDRFGPYKGVVERMWSSDCLEEVV